MVEVAIETREIYVDYFRKQPGFVSSTFYRTSRQNDATRRTGSTLINFINVVVWASQEACDAVINQGYENADGTNRDGMKVLGKGFPPPIVVHPGLFQIIGR